MTETDLIRNAKNPSKRPPGAGARVGLLISASEVDII